MSARLVSGARRNLPVAVHLSENASQRAIDYAMYPNDEEILTRIGELGVELLDPGPAWIVRRKETVTLLDERTVRRQMSIDYSLPEYRPATRRWMDKKVWYAPLFFLQKGSDERFDPDAPLAEPEPHFASFDFYDGGGKSISLPPRAWNAEVTARLLAAAIDRAAKRHDVDTSDKVLHAIASDLAKSEQLRAGQLLDKLRAGESADNEGQQTEDEQLLRALDALDPFLHRMLDAAAISSVVMVPLVGEEARAGIVKLSYDWQVATLSSGGLRRLNRPLAALGWIGYEMWIDVPYIGASTYHFELESPEGLEVYDSGLVSIGAGPLREGHQQSDGVHVSRASGATSRLHLYADEQLKEAKAFAWLRFRVRRQEFAGGALIAAVMVAAVLWAAWALRNEVRATPASVPALLLLFPSLIAAYVVRPGPHRLTVRMLRYARVLVGLSACLPFIAAGFLALAARDARGKIIDTGFYSWWWHGAIAATVLLVLLLVGYVSPITELKRQRLMRKQED